VKIEYFDLGKGEPPFILIYGNEPRNIETLVGTASALCRGKWRYFAVNEFGGFDDMKEERLVWPTQKIPRQKKE
jgi:hypothetical protein